MSFVAQIEADFKTFFAKIKDHFSGIEHPIVAEGEALAARLKTAAKAVELQGVSDATTLEHDAVQAGETVAKDAETAMGPVLAEAEKDATTLGAEAAHDVAKAITDPTPPAAS